MLRKIFGSKGEEVIGEWKRLNIEDLYNLNSSPNVIQGTKSRRCGGRCTWPVWETGDVHTGIWWENTRERHHLENPGVDGRLILKYIFKKWDTDWIDVA